MKRFLSLFVIAILILSTFAVIPVMATTDVVEIGTYDELKALDAAVDGGNNYSGKTVVLTADIAVNLDDWVGIGNGTTSFSGVFDGNGHTITFSGTGADGYYADALFVYTDGAVIQNLKLAGEATVDGKSGNRVTGLLIGSTKGSATTVKNVQNSATINYINNVDTMGGFVGLVNAPTTFEGCVFDGVLNFAAQVTLVGGFAGQIDQPATFKDCVYAGTLMFNNNNFSDKNAGFVGRVNGTASFTDCISVGSMTFAFDSLRPNAILVGNFNNGGTASATNVYYVDIQKSDQSGPMDLSCDAGLTTNNVKAKSNADIAALTEVAFSADSTMSVKAATADDVFYPCPEGLVPAEGWLTSLTASFSDVGEGSGEVEIGVNSSANSGENNDENNDENNGENNGEDNGENTENTQTPDNTDDSTETTKAPETTKVPETTKAPANTDAPADDTSVTTDSADAVTFGCGSVVGVASVALIAMLAGAAVMLKKEI